MAPRKLAAGNWKMDGTRAALAEIAALAPQAGGVDVLICPPATLVAPMAEAAPKGIAVGGQDCHAEASGAHTGDIAAEQLRELLLRDLERIRTQPGNLRNPVRVFDNPHRQPLLRSRLGHVESF